MFEKSGVDDHEPPPEPSAVQLVLPHCQAAEALPNTLAKVEHPSIVPVYETGETDGVPWIAMKFIEGKSLAEVLTQLPLAPSTPSNIGTTSRWPGR